MFGYFKLKLFNGGPNNKHLSHIQSQIDKEVEFINFENIVCSVLFLALCDFSGGSDPRHVEAKGKQRRHPLMDGHERSLTKS